MADDEISSSRKWAADTEACKDQRPDGDSFSDDPEVGGPLQKKWVVDREINEDSGTSARVTEGDEEDEGERKEVLAEVDRMQAEKSEVNVVRENVEGESVEVANEERVADKVKITGEGENVGGETKEVDCEMGKDGGGKGCGEEKENEGEKEDDVEGGRNVTDKTEDPKPATNFSSFQNLSSSQNAFSGLAGTGFSTTSFTFGSSTSSTHLFGAVPANNGISITGLNTNPTETNNVIMHEVHVETGEENEKAVFTADAVLYEHLDGGWKERGKGELKLNLTTTGINKARLVMRARGNYRLILNASLYADMALKEMDKKGATFLCVNGTGEGQKTGPSTFALKFKDGGTRDDFCASVEAHKAKPVSQD